MHRTRSTCCARTASGHARRARLILACGDVDSWAPSSAREQGADIPLYFRTFLQLDVSEGRTQHESEFASFGIIRVLQCLSLESIPAKFKEPVDVLLRILAGELRVLVNELFGVNARCGFSG